MRLGEVLWSEVSHKKTTFNPAVFPSKKTRFIDMPGRQHGQPRTFLVFVAAETVDCGFTAARADLLRAQYVSSHGSSSSGEGAFRGVKDMHRIPCTDGRVDRRRNCT